MSTAIIWVLSFSVIGTTPESGELAKFKTKQECQQALEQKRQEYKEKNKKVAGSCYQTTKSD